MGIQELRRSFVLPHLDMAEVRCDSNDSIVAHLVDVLVRGEDSRTYRSHRLRVANLIAGVAKCGQTELILYPLAKVAGAVHALRFHLRVMWQSGPSGCCPKGSDKASSADLHLGVSIRQDCRLPALANLL